MVTLATEYFYRRVFIFMFIHRKTRLRHTYPTDIFLQTKVFSLQIERSSYMKKLVNLETIRKEHRWQVKIMSDNRGDERLEDEPVEDLEDIFNEDAQVIGSRQTGEQPFGGDKPLKQGSPGQDDTREPPAPEKGKRGRPPTKDKPTSEKKPAESDSDDIPPKAKPKKGKPDGKTHHNEETSDSADTSVGKGRKPRKKRFAEIHKELFRSVKRELTNGIINEDQWKELCRLHGQWQGYKTPLAHPSLLPLYNAIRNKKKTATSSAAAKMRKSQEISIDLPGTNSLAATRPRETSDRKEWSLEMSHLAADLDVALSLLADQGNRAARKWAQAVKGKDWTARAKEFRSQVGSEDDWQRRQQIALGSDSSGSPRRPSARHPAPPHPRRRSRSPSLPPAKKRRSTSPKDDRRHRPHSSPGPTPNSWSPTPTYGFGPSPPAPQSYFYGYGQPNVPAYGQPTQGYGHQAPPPPTGYGHQHPPPPTGYGPPTK